MLPCVSTRTFALIAARAPSPPSAGGSTAPLATREAVKVVTSQRVLAAASRSVFPPVSVSKLARWVRVVAHGEVLSIQVKAPSTDAAMQLANAIVDAYVNYSRGLGSGTLILQVVTKTTPRSLISPIDGIGGARRGISDGRCDPVEGPAGVAGRTVDLQLEATSVSNRYRRKHPCLAVVLRGGPTTANSLDGRCHLEGSRGDGC